MNSIAAYLISDLFGESIQRNLHIHLGYRVFQLFGTALEPLMFGIVTLLIYWSILFWMYRRKIFLRI
jgi:predicted acyltransferase